MSTRDRIEEAVQALLTEIAAAADDDDVTQQARDDLNRLGLAIGRARGQFNVPEWPDHTDGGPAPEDLKGTVTHGG